MPPFDSTEASCRAALALAVILAASILVGHPQEAYYLLLALGGWVAFDGLVAIRSGRGREAFGLWATWIGALALMVGLIGVELVPDAMAQEWGLQGAKLPLRVASRYHVYPINILQLLSPRALGGPSDYFGHDNYWESVTSIGLIPLSLAIIAVAWSPHRRTTRGWLILIVASVLIASGRKLGLFAVLFEVVPGMDRFRVAARSLFLASLGASMLAGLGVEALLARSAECLSWRRLARCFGFALAILGHVVLSGAWLAETRKVASTVLNRPSVTLQDRASGHRPHNQATEFDRMLLSLSRLSTDPAFWLTMVAVPLGLAIASRRPGERRAIAAALGLLGLVELGFHGHELIKTTPCERFLGPDPISEALLRARPTGLEPPRIRAVDTLYDDLRAGAMGLSKTNVYDSFQIQHAADLYQPLYRLFDADLSDRGAPMDRAVADDRREIRQLVLDRMGVSLLVDDRVDPSAPWPLVDSGTWNGSTFAVYRNATALPRAYVVPRAEVAPADRLIVGRFRDVDPRRAVLMPNDPLRPGSKQAPAVHAGRVGFDRPRPSGPPGHDRSARPPGRRRDLDAGMARRGRRQTRSRPAREPRPEGRPLARTRSTRNLPALLAAWLEPRPGGEDRLDHPLDLARPPCGGSSRVSTHEPPTLVIDSARGDSLGSTWSRSGLDSMNAERARVGP